MTSHVTAASASHCASTSTSPGDRHWSVTIAVVTMPRRHFWSRDSHVVTTTQMHSFSERRSLRLFCADHSYNDCGTSVLPPIVYTLDASGFNFHLEFCRWKPLVVTEWISSNWRHILKFQHLLIGFKWRQQTIGASSSISLKRKICGPKGRPFNCSAYSDLCSADALDRWRRHSPIYRRN